jgi:hypothetical protein
MTITCRPRPLSQALLLSLLVRRPLAAAAATIVDLLVGIVVEQLGDAELMVPDQLGGDPDRCGASREGASVRGKLSSLPGWRDLLKVCATPASPRR